MVAVAWDLDGAGVAREPVIAPAPASALAPRGPRGRGLEQCAITVTAGIWGVTEISLRSQGQERF